jgi:hypothetical protein
VRFSILSWRAPSARTALSLFALALLASAMSTFDRLPHVRTGRERGALPRHLMS